jgi:hypothetical protein
VKRNYHFREIIVDGKIVSKLTLSTVNGRGLGSTGSGQGHWRDVLKTVSIVITVAMARLSRDFGPYAITFPGGG